MYGWIQGGGGRGGGIEPPPPHIDSDRLVCALISCDLSIWYFLCVKKNKVNVLLPDSIRTQFNTKIWDKWTFQLGYIHNMTRLS